MPIGFWFSIIKMDQVRVKPILTTYQLGRCLNRNLFKETYPHSPLTNEEAIWVSPCLAPENGEDKAVEEHGQGQPSNGLNPPEPGVCLLITSLAKENHAQDNKTIDAHHKVSLQHELGLAGSMDVSNSSTLTFMDKWRTSDVVPHLARQHREDKEDRKHTPGGLVEEELEVVPPQVNQPTHQPKQDKEGHGASIIRRSEHTDVHLRPLIDPPRDSLARKANSLYIHVVLLFRLTLGRKMYESRSTVQVHTLKSLTAFIEIHHCKKHFA